MADKPRLAGSSLSQLPVVTWTLSVIAIALPMSADWSDWLSYDRTAIAAGEFWRLITGHLTHWNTDHMVWDVFMFAWLGSMIERDDRSRLIATLLFSAADISTTMWFCQPAVEQYRGLSGIDSALFLSVAITLLYEKCRAKQPIAALALVALMIGFVAKLVFEVATGTTLFVDSSAAGFTPLPFVHAVGGSAGAVALFYGNHKQVPAFCSVLNRPAATTDDTPELIRVRVSSQNGRRRGAWLARRG